MSRPFAAWVEEAARLPLAFAQVREDPLLDQWVVEAVGQDANILMIASGGCTAAYLAADPRVARLHLVDANPAQLALARVKLRLLQTATPAERLRTLGHALCPMAERQAALNAELTALGLPPDVFGPLETISAWGVDHAGRYERVFRALQAHLAERRPEIARLLTLPDPAEQGRRIDPGVPLHQALDAALDEAMALPNLVRLFGEEATRNPVESFSRHFARRIRHVLGTLPAADNPYLWQMLQGRYPENAPAPWFTAAPPARLPEVTLSKGFMTDVLAKERGYDFVHLSNILDWLTPEQGRATLDLAAQALVPGGWTLIRQLNSTLDIPALGKQFEWLSDQARALHAKDRSFFYRALHLGRKR